MKAFGITILIFMSLMDNLQAQNKRMDRQGEAYFSSETLIHNLEGINEQVLGGFNIKTGKMAFVMLISGFSFENSVMDKHFKTHYLETDKYPRVLFKGNIAPHSDINFNKPGTFITEVAGEIEIHGVRRQIITEVEFEITSSGVIANSTFDITMEDFGIRMAESIESQTIDVIELSTSFNF